MFWSKVRNCGTCKFYDQGACRRFPPARVYTPSGDKPEVILDVTVWPVVKPENWCGEWKRA